MSEQDLLPLEIIITSRSGQRQSLLRNAHSKKSTPALLWYASIFLVTFSLVFGGMFLWFENPLAAPGSVSTASITPILVAEATATVTSLPPVSPTATASATTEQLPSPTLSPTNIPLPTNTAVPAIIPSSTNTPQPAPTEAPPNTPQPSPTQTATATATETATATATETATTQPTDTPEPSPTNTSTPTATPTLAVTATETPTPEVSPTDTSEPTVVPTNTPTATPPPPLVVMMDGHHPLIVYDAETRADGGSNADDINAIVSTLSIDTAVMYTSPPHWQGVSTITSLNPQLIIIHASAFFRGPQQETDHKAEFEQFLKDIESSSIQVLIYSRTETPEAILIAQYEGLASGLAGRVDVLAVDYSNPQEFKWINLEAELHSRVINILTLD